MKNILVIALFLCSLSGQRFATDYHVSPTGNDSNSGTAGSPFLTVYHAVGVATTSGDNVYIHAGTYNETSQIVISTGVDIIGDDSSTTKITSTVNSFQNPMILLGSSDGTNGNQTISGLTLDGQSLSTSWGIFIYGRSNVTVRDCQVKDFGDRGVIFAATSGFAEAPPSIYATGNSCYNNRITNSAAFYGSYGTGCLNIGGQEDMTVYNNTIIQNQRAIGDNGWCIKHFQGGYWNNVKIHDNSLTKIVWTGTYGGEFGWNFAIESYHHSGLEIYNNTISGGSIDLNYCSKGAYTYGAYIHDNTMFVPDSIRAAFHDAIHLEFSLTDVIISRNTCYNMAGFVVFATRAHDSLNRIKINNNLAYNLGRSQGDGNNGVAVGTYSEGTYDYTIDSFVIKYNTFIASSGARPFEGIHINGVDNGDTGSINRLYVDNNIIQGFYESYLRINNGSFCTNLFVRYNNLYLNNMSNDPYITGGTPIGYATNNIIKSDPLFVGTGGNPWFLQVGSLSHNTSSNGTDRGYTGDGDVTPPTVIATNPSSGAIGSPVSGAITVTFDNTMDASTLIGANCYATWSGGTVSASIVTGSDYVIITPLTHLQYNTVFTVHIENVKDASGNTIASPYTFTFTTQTTPITGGVKKHLK